MSQLAVSELLKIKEPADRVQLSLSPNGEWLAFCLNGQTRGHLSSGVSQVGEVSILDAEVINWNKKNE